MAERDLVYSTDGSRRRDLRAAPPPAARPTPRRPVRAPKAAPSVPNDGIVRLIRERGGRGGKVVTVVRGLPVRGPALATLAADLKKRCGAGGAVKGDVIEIQGDHRDRIAAALRALGHTVKLAGG